MFNNLKKLQDKPRLNQIGQVRSHLHQEVLLQELMVMMASMELMVFPEPFSISTLVVLLVTDIRCSLRFSQEVGQMDNMVPMD